MKASTPLIANAFSALFLALGCASDTGVSDPSTNGDATPPSLASLRYSAWSEPVNLGTTINSTSTENTPEISKDGLSLYFGSPRFGGSGSTDLWVSHRACTDTDDIRCGWQKPANLGGTVNSNELEAGPDLTRDGHRMFYSSARPGGEGSNDLYVSQRACTDADDPACAWGAPVSLGSALNTGEFEGGPSARGSEFYFNRGNVPGGGTSGGTPADIYVSHIENDENDVFGTATRVDNLNSPRVDQRPSIRFDGHEIFLASDRDLGFGSHDIWVSSRQGNDEPWTMPVNLGPLVNTELEETHPAISADGTALFFARRRSPTEGCGGPLQPPCDLDLYFTTRTVE